jgi:two-component system, cell cycle response regulator DivK
MPNTQPFPGAPVPACDVAAGRQPADFHPVVLVVDDYEDNRFLIRYLLETRGCRVVEAGDGVEAVETALCEHPDLILMDVSLPRLDGLSATRLIRQEATLRDVPVVAVSGHAAPKDRARALAAGCDGYITKPIDFVEMDRALSSLLPAHKNADGSKADDE